MVVFGALSVIAIIIFFLIMPETKGKSVEEINEMFENNTFRQLGTIRKASRLDEPKSSKAQNIENKQ